MVAENKRESALEFISIGKLTFEEIAKGTGLSVEEIRTLANRA
jgi:DNA-directed RNA polymerase specialized sigma24 family protein